MIRPILLALILAAPAAARSQTLTVDFIDVEGGQATLFLTPTHQSLLIDTGWPANNGRDADRIVAAAHKLGITRIDYVLLTHYHDDHAGGVPQLAARIPIGAFIDHGPNRELSSPPTVAGYAAYQQLLATGKFQHLLAHPGDRLPVTGIAATVISADGNLIAHSLPGVTAAPNPFCKTSETRPADTSENGRSLGIEIDFGRLRILDLGDLTWDKEMQLMCPANPLGHIDILVLSHHGWYQSSSPALIDAIAPRVAIMDNGATKGGSIATFNTLAGSPGLETLWQLHFSEEAKDLNAPDKYIANPHAFDSAPDAANSIELIVHPDGAFEITNTRTHFTQPYPAAK